MNVRIEETYKARDVEEKIDLLFYRPVGFRIALAAERLGLTPNTITYISIALGVFAGHFFFYDSIALYLLGIGIWAIANAFDSADGQLARMTNSSTEFGRIIDGMGGNFIFFSIYFHVSLRHALNDGIFGWWIFPIALTAGACHAVQSAMADLYRQGYIRYGVDAMKGELTYSSIIREEYEQARFWDNPFRKFFLRVYLNFTTQQEQLSPQFQRFRAFVDATFGRTIPPTLSALYRRLNKPLLKYYNYMTINGRVMTFFAFILIGFPHYFFFVEIILMSLLLWAVLRRQERNNEVLTDEAMRLAATPIVPDQWRAIA
jgi:phosphatidylglycerophosphate synthase